MKRALFVGRFQPLHIGHESVIREMDKSLDLEEILIGIGSTQYSDTLDNPFTVLERESMIRESLDGKISKPYQIIHIPDLHDYPQWVPYVLSKVPKFDVVYCGNTVVSELFRDNGFEVRKPEFSSMSSTKLRQHMISDGTLSEVNGI